VRSFSLRMPLPLSPIRWTRLGAEAAFLVVMGLAMAFIGPYGTGALPAPARVAYWLSSIVGGGVIGIAIDSTLGRRVSPLWRRIMAVSLVMTPAVAALVLCVGRLLVPSSQGPVYSLPFLLQVLVISGLVMTLRALAWRAPRMRVVNRTVIAAPLPEAEAAFRRRLSARRRSARLIAIRAEDHYLRVHTDAGEELLTLRFADALADLAGAAGFRTHRSWWVAADAIEAVRWRKGAGEARLTGGLVAPVSRSHAPALKAAGWI